MSALLQIRKNWRAIYFVLSLCLIFFMLGLSAGVFQLFPYQPFKNGTRAIADLWKERRAYTFRPQDRFLVKTRFSKMGLVRHDEDRAYPGVTLYSGLKGERLALHLIDMEGKLLHQWTVSFNELWPNATHMEKQPSDLHLLINGARLFENGDVIFNLYQAGMVRMDRCGQVVWKRPYRTHHQFSLSDDNSIWVPGLLKTVAHYPVKDPSKFGKADAKPVDDHPGLSLTRPETLFEVSMDGELLRAFDLADVFFRSGRASELLITGTEGAPKVDFETVGDYFTHLNKIDVLTKKMAPAFPMFEEGDLLLSIRNQNLLAVFDPDSEKIKWSFRGPFFWQHDADFLPTGRILLFDNRGAILDSQARYGSRLLSIDPATGQVETLYEGKAGEAFFSSSRGNQQLLPNGNILVVESNWGRLFEIDPTGRIVWSFIIAWDEDEVVKTYEASRYPRHYADFSRLNCPAPDDANIDSKEKNL